MKKDYKFFIYLVLGAAVYAVVFLSPLGYYFKINFRINDFPQRYASSIFLSPPENLKIVAVAIDENSLNKIGLRWPWKRGIYAQAIKALNDENVNTIGLDLAFVGKSEDPEDDRALEEALKNTKSRVILGYIFDPQQAVPVFPLEQLKNTAGAIGVVNTPRDRDEVVRRLRNSIQYDGADYYSFSVAMAASFLEKTPASVSKNIYTLPDGTYFINYFFKPGQILKIGFYDLLSSLKSLKEKYGADFLKGSIVIIYPEADIFHDSYLTPVGNMPGGLIHLNGATGIISARNIRETGILTYIFLAVSVAAVILIFYFTGFISGAVFFAGLIFLNFWLAVFSWINGASYDFSGIILFCLVYFIIGIFFKYTSFFTQLLKIRDKVTRDPMRNIFTLRYFYHRLSLEINKIYFGKDLFLIFIFLGDAKSIFYNKKADEITLFWKRLHYVLAHEINFWAAYSQDELVGFCFQDKRKAAKYLSVLKESINSVFQQLGYSQRVKIGAFCLKKNYNIGELLAEVSKNLRSSAQEIVLSDEAEISVLHQHILAKDNRENKYLESIDEDIEEKNRQLLMLIDSLNREHTKTKEAFFNIITSLVNALEARDLYTKGHSQRVARYAVILAEKLGWDEIQREKLRKASLMHDVGKIGIPDNILHKKGKLSDEEFEVIKQHEIVGVKILEPLKEFADILPWILYHHERWDGAGYPYGIAQNEIPEAAQIISLADVFDALTTGRDYKIAFSFEDSIAMILQDKGTRFNPELTEIFVDVLRSYKDKI